MSISNRKRKQMVGAILGAQDAYELAGFTYGQRYCKSTLELYPDDNLRLEMRCVSKYLNKCIKIILVKNADEEIADDLSKRWYCAMSEALVRLKRAMS